MRARDLVTDFPRVTPDTPVVEAARLLATHDLPGLIVMARTHSPLVAVVGDGRLLGAVTLKTLLNRALPQ
ncbi:CBS domain-containing protein [Acrocarpospora sp. B8E8]|uniref:CBS domain-containing protein n=1 Tax=Acrocarpospora sp. B8E8 TaxID=3153572 RepID=UPI00325D59AE